MKPEKITIEFDDEKLEALRFHMEMKEADLESELVSDLNKIYEKYVPQAIRLYLDRNRKEPVKKKTKAEAVDVDETNS